MMLMTPWLSFWTSPVLIGEHTNQQLLVCTINGVEWRSIPSADKQLEQWQEHCNALQLADTLSHSTPPNVDQKKLQRYPDKNKRSPSFYHYVVPHISAYIGRAPPYS